MQVKGTVEELKKSSQKDQDALPPGATATKADEANGEAAAGARAEETPSDDRQQRASATAGTGKGSSGGQDQGQTGGSGEGQTAGAASSTASLMSRLRSMAEVVRKEVRAIAQHMPGVEDIAIWIPMHMQAMRALLQVNT